MIERVLNIVEKYDMLTYNDKVVVGVSGGADSITLLHILKTISPIYNLQLFAVHVNHCIRGDEALRDENFVKEVCNGIKVKFYNFKVNIKVMAKEKGLTEEEAGRYARYKYFNEVLCAEGANKIAVAHNLNDNAETIIMRMIRGSGLIGLRGILPVYKNIIRPLIGLTRKEIEKYCNNENIKYIIDSTNYEDKYTRNKIRYNVVGFIESEINPSFLQTVFRTTELLNEENTYLEKEAFKALNFCLEKIIIEEKIILNIKKLNEYDKVIQRRIIILAYYKLKNNFKNIAKHHIESILDLIGKDTGKKLNITKNIIAEKQYQNLCIYINNLTPKFFCYNIKLDEMIFIKQINKYIMFSSNKNNLNLKNVCTIELSCAKLIDKLKLRNRMQGDIIRIGGCTKKIKKYFIDKKVPQTERNLIPLLANGNDIVCIFNEENQVSDTYKLSDDENNKDVVYVQIWED